MATANATRPRYKTWPKRPCKVCGKTNRSKFQLCATHVRPQPTQTHAWCAKGAHMVENSGFAKNQNTCRECRRVHYNYHSNMSEGKTCGDCGTPVANTNRGGRCMACHRRHVSRERIKTPPRRYINAHGYVVLTSQWNVANHDKRGNVLEHVKVMAEVLGRPIRKGENIHHINGVRDDNRPENLELWNTSQPAGQRVTDKVAWAKELLSIYEPSALS